jgi:hypothetical protein
MKKTFDVNIYFLGLFGVVADPRAGQQVALVVPRTDHGRPKYKNPAQDGKPLYRHRWFIEFPPGQLTGTSVSLPADTLALWTLSRRNSFHRVTFESDAGALQIGKGLDRVCDFSQVAPDNADLPSDHLKWPADGTVHPQVAGQIMFKEGSLVDFTDADLQQWSFPGTLNGGKVWEEPASHIIHLKLEDVTNFAIHARRNKKDTKQTLAFRGKPKKPVNITICNLCDVNPLRWPTPGSPRVDDDYRWYYQLVDPGYDLSTKLNGLDLPVPHPSRKPNALGQNCLETKFNARSFKID